MIKLKEEITKCLFLGNVEKGSADRFYPIKQTTWGSEGRQFTCPERSRRKSARPDFSFKKNRRDLLIQWKNGGTANEKWLYQHARWTSQGLLL